MSRRCRRIILFVFVVVLQCSSRRCFRSQENDVLPAIIKRDLRSNLQINLQIGPLSLAALASTMALRATEVLKKSFEKEQRGFFVQKRCRRRVPA